MFLKKLHIRCMSFFTQNLINNDQIFFSPLEKIFKIMGKPFEYHRGVSDSNLELREKYD